MSDAACDGKPSEREFEPSLIHLTFPDFVQEARRSEIVSEIVSGGDRRDSILRVRQTARGNGSGVVFDQSGNYARQASRAHQEAIVKYFRRKRY